MERALWVIVLVVLAALVMYGMRRGWVNRARGQAAQLPEFPAAPVGIAEQPQLLSEETGFYVGTTRAGDWQDRIVVGDVGHRAEAVAKLHESGLLLERTGATPLWIPAELFRDARVDHKLANKVVPGAGMLVVTWQLGDHALDTGFRADDKAPQTTWAETLRAMVPGRDEPIRGDETAGARQEEL